MINQNPAPAGARPITPASDVPSHLVNDVHGRLADRRLPVRVFAAKGSSTTSPGSTVQTGSGDTPWSAAHNDPSRQARAQQQ